jgi:hypothetical protein
MQDHEYRRKIHPEAYRRNWVFTGVTTLLFLAVVWGIVATWRYVGHDIYIIGTVIVPAGIVALFLLIAAINGRKEVIKEAYASSLELIFWWRQ